MNVSKPSDPLINLLQNFCWKSHLQRSSPFYHSNTVCPFTWRPISLTVVSTYVTALQNISKLLHIVKLCACDVDEYIFLFLLSYNFVLLTFYRDLGENRAHNPILIPLSLYHKAHLLVFILRPITYCRFISFPHLLSLTCSYSIGHGIYRHLHLFM